MVASVLPAGRRQLSATRRYISVWTVVKHSTVDKWGQRVKRKKINEREGD